MPASKALSLNTSKSEPLRIPKHIAIVMDGNGRWANDRGLPRLYGHRQGVQALRRTLVAAKDLGVRYLTVWAFSTENWNRPLEEVNGLMSLFRHYIKKELAELHKNGIKLRFIGRRQDLPSDIVAMVDRAEDLTKNNDDFHLVVALNYGGRDDIVRCARSLAKKVSTGELSPNQIDEATFSEQLDTSTIPDPDILIRPSGEIRLSGFLLWQASYSELVFVDTYWPDFGKSDLEFAIREYQKRDRRFGALTS